MKPREFWIPWGVGGFYDNKECNFAVGELLSGEMPIGGGIKVCEVLPEREAAIQKMVEALEHYQKIDTKIWCAETDSEITVMDWADDALMAWKKANE